MSNNLNIGGPGSQPSPEELAAAQNQAAQVQKEGTQSTYLISSQLQFMIDSLKNMASQLQHRIDEAKEKTIEKASTGVGSSPSAPPDKIEASSLINTTNYPPNAAGFATALITSPAQTESKAQLLLLSTNIDNGVQQLAKVQGPLQDTLASNVNPAALSSSLQKHLLDTRDAVNQIETALQTAPAPSSSLKTLQNNLTQAAQTLLKQLSPIPEDTEALKAFSQKLNTQVQSPTSGLNQLHLQHQKTVNEVGGSLSMVLPSSSLAASPQARGLGIPQGGLGGPQGGGGLGGPRGGGGFGGAQGGGGVGGPQGGGGLGGPQGGGGLGNTPVPSSHNPWSEVWQWIFGSSGMMNDIGTYMSKLNNILTNQNSALKGFSGLLTIFQDLAENNVKSHINGSVTPGEKTGWREMHKMVQGMKGFLNQLGTKGIGNKAKTDFSKLNAAINKIETSTKGPLHQLFNSMKAGFNGMIQEMQSIVQLVDNGYSGGGASEAPNNDDGNQPQPVHPNYGAGAPQPNKAEFLSALNQDANKFNAYAANFARGAKDGGSNIQSMQTQTQSKVKTNMMYYQQLLQTGPSLVQTLGQLAAAVANNLKGG